MSDIRRTGDGPTSISNDRGDIGLPTGDDSDPLRALIGRESADEIREGLRSAIGQLELIEAEVVIGLAGLWDHEPESMGEVALQVGRDESEVRRIR